MSQVYHRLQNKNGGNLDKKEAACWIFDPEYRQYLWTEEDRLRLREKVDGVCRILTYVLRGYSTDHRADASQSKGSRDMGDSHPSHAGGARSARPERVSSSAQGLRVFL
jgi:hypothetical protein